MSDRNLKMKEPRPLGWPLRISNNNHEKQVIKRDIRSSSSEHRLFIITSRSIHFPCSAIHVELHRRRACRGCCRHGGGAAVWSSEVHGCIRHIERRRAPIPRSVGQQGTQPLLPWLSRRETVATSVQSDVLVVWEGRNRSTIGLTWGWRMTGTRPAGRPHSPRPGGRRGCCSRGTSCRRRRKGRS